MTLPWREHPAAHEELLAAALHLDDQRPGLGDLLLDAVERAILSVRRSPRSWPPLASSTRGTVIRSRAVQPFRLRIVYAASDGSILVLAYTHESRRPGYWSARLASDD